MKLKPIGRGSVYEIWSDQTWSNGSYMVLSSKEWDKIESWCRKAKIYYAKSGNMISFFKDTDVSAFLLRWS